MTFQSSYAKLLADPDFGTIKKRKEHAKQMYVEGMKRAADICRSPLAIDSISNQCASDIEQAIAEESK